MGVTVLHPQDCLKQPFSHMKYPKNPNKQKKPVSNRMRRSRSPLRNSTNRSLSPPLPFPRDAVSTDVAKVTVKKSPNIVAGNLRILKRGEELPQKRVDLDVENLDLGSTCPIGPDPGKIPSQICKLKSAPFYAGPVTMTSPSPSDVPVPAFTTKRSVSLFKATEATKDLIRILSLDMT